MLASKGWKSRLVRWTGICASLLLSAACGRGSQETEEPKAQADAPAGIPGTPQSKAASNDSPPSAGAVPLVGAAPEDSPSPDEAQPKPRWQAVTGFQEDAALTCPKRNAPGVGILKSVMRPSPRTQLSILVAALGNEQIPEIRVTNSKGQALEFKGRARSGIPAIADLQLGTLPKGKYEVKVKQGDKVVACSRFVVRARSKAPALPKSIERAQMWKPTGSWTPGHEALYAAWIVLLFDGPTQEDLAWRAMHEVTRDPKRNWLWNRKGWGEDDPDGLKLKPDCADAPYFLRAYYAWKLDLPFMFHRCNRGTATKAPRCRSTQTAQEAPIYRKRWLSRAGDWGAYNRSIKDALRQGEPYPVYEGPLKTNDSREVLEYFFSRTVGWGVHTGNGRVAWKDTNNDFYPVALTRENLRPGTIYADPYGHILLLVDLHAGADGSPGVLFAVDGQPDASITRKRFWQGNFLWNPDPKLGGSGFKAFRPLVYDKKTGETRMLTLQEIAQRPGYSKHAGDLTRFSKVGFYDHMERQITPGVVKPKRALRQLVDALAEAVRIRIRSVQNGVDWAKDNPGKSIAMPSGYKLFETTGPWENFSTPARDLRLLIAIDAVNGFPAKVGRNPSAYGVSAGQETKVVAQLRQDLKGMLQEPKYEIEYLNSAAAPVKLSLAQVVARAAAFEMAYNPNDCPEIRWGARPKSAEAKACRRRASKEQRAQMQRYRPWFSQRRRPARGEQAPG